MNSHAHAVSVTRKSSVPLKGPSRFGHCRCEGDDAVLRSNRSAAHAKLSQFAAALEDADVAATLRPTWARAYGRRAAALHGLRRWEEAEAAYTEALALEPSSAQFAEGLRLVKEAAQSAASQ